MKDEDSEDVKAKVKKEEMKDTKPKVKKEEKDLKPKVKKESIDPEKEANFAKGKLSWLYNSTGPNS